MDIIKELVRIKRVRRDTRERELHRARRTWEEASLDFRKACDVHEENTQARAAKEEELDRGIMSRAVVVRDLDDLHLEFAAMKEEARREEEVVEKARGHREERRHEMVRATDVWRVAAQVLDKFTDLHAQRLAERAVAAERLADLELEEHAPRRREDDVELEELH
jgi:hypothetical protein